MKKLNGLNVSPFVHGCQQMRQNSGQLMALIFLDILPGYFRYAQTRNFLKKAELSFVFRLRLFQLLVNNLQIMHNAGIFHRDLKWGNIVISENLQSIKFIDFGMATKQPIESHYLPSSVPCYIAPECAYMQTPLSSAAIDVFGAGIAGLDIIATQVDESKDFPVEGCWPAVSQASIEQHYVELDQNITGYLMCCYHIETPELGSLIKSMLEVDPARRANLQTISAKLNHIINQ